MADLRRERPDRAVESWCEGEARLGLKPVVRRVWALGGTRPPSNGRHKFESVFVYGFAHPRGGRSRFLIRPKANAECMGHALADFAGWADPEGRKTFVVVVDGSGGHTAEKLVVPPNVVLHRRPSRTPELQPAEHLWPLVRGGVANRVFDTPPKWTEVLTTRCRWLTDQPTAVAGAVGFHRAVAARRLRTNPTWYEWWSEGEEYRFGRANAPSEWRADAAEMSRCSSPS